MSMNTSAKNKAASMRAAIMALILMTAMAAQSCNDEYHESETVIEQYDTIYSGTETIKKIAIIAPMSEGFSQSWRNIINIFEDNYAKTKYTANKTFNTFIKFQYEWYDERTITDADMAELGKKLAADPEIEVVIGPMFAQNLKIVGKCCREKNKVLISPRCTNATEVRELALNYSDFFSLVETDITETQMILASMKKYGINEACMIAPNTPKGDSYSDYFGFWCEECGIDALYTAIYDPDDPQTLDQAMDTVIKIAVSKFKLNGLSLNKIGVINVPEKVANINVLNDWEKYVQKSETINVVNSAHKFFANTAFTPETSTSLSFRGCGVSAEPESGFQLEYSAMYNDILYGGMPQLYDAMLLVMLSEYKMLKNPSLKLAEAIRQIFVPDDGADHNYQYVWNPAGMSRMIAGIYSGNEPATIGGASGPLVSNPKIKNMISQTVYTLYEYNGRTKKYTSLGFSSKNGSGKSSSLWNMIPVPESGMSDTQSENIQYDKLNGNWALLVAASDKWQNYRHQADILTMYQRLKANGFDDKHIILIASNDIASNKNNPPEYMGKVINSSNQVVNTNVETDYTLEQLKKGEVKIADILSGNGPDGKVIKANQNENILVFWSGHGAPGNLIIGDGTENNSTEFTYSDMKETLSSCSGKFRQMLWIIETCFGGSVGKACEGYSGVLCITAAGENEKSIATKEQHPDLRLSVSNNFTMLMEETLSQRSNSISILELYKDLYSESMGSHAKCYNSTHFGELRSISIGDFVTAVK